MMRIPCPRHVRYLGCLIPVTLVALLALKWDEVLASGEQSTLDRVRHLVGEVQKAASERNQNVDALAAALEAYRRREITRLKEAWKDFTEDYKRTGGKGSPNWKPKDALDEEPVRVIADAIHVLGALRCGKAVPILVAYLNFNREAGFDDLPGARSLARQIGNEPKGWFCRGTYPAVPALVRVGMPAVGPVWENMISPENTNWYRIRKGFCILGFILGRGRFERMVKEQLKDRYDAGDIATARRIKALARECGGFEFLPEHPVDPEFKEGVWPLPVLESFPMPRPSPAEN